MGKPKFLNGIDLNGQIASNASDASSPTDLVTLQQVQALLAGLSWKDEVKAASTGNVTLASGVANGSTLDGVTLATGDRILLKDQTTAADNGIYRVNASGAPTRATDADSTAELENATVFVSQGTVNADKAYTQTATIATVGTTAQTWVQFGAGVSYSATNGLQLSGQTFSLLLDTSSGLSVSGTGVKVDFTVVTRTVGFNCAATTNPQTFSHNLNKTDVMVQLWETSTGKWVIADVTRVDANSISVDFGAPPSASQYRVVVEG